VHPEFSDGSSVEFINFLSKSERGFLWTSESVEAFAKEFSIHERVCILAVGIQGGQGALQSEASIYEFKPKQRGIINYLGCCGGQ
jgi:hypothetical protein